MLRCSIKLLLTIFAISAVQAAPSHVSSECLENKLDLLLEKLAVYNGSVGHLSSLPKLETPSSCLTDRDQKDINDGKSKRSVDSHHIRHYRRRDTSSTKCSDRLAQICQSSGISEIQVDGGISPFTVLCDGNRWVVIMQRLDGSVAFHNRTWDSYKMGFGSISQTSEFFLGLQHLHELTVNDFFELRIDLEDFNGVQKYAQYSDFNVLSENTAYKLGILGAYEGTAGDSMKYHEGQQFSTVDRDNDARSQGSCSEEYNSPGWFKNCMDANIFGNYLQGDTDKFKEGMFWETFRGPMYSLKRVKMSIRARC